ncbi:MAG: HAD family hydrolase [Nanoarchaeota archaeon]|nr:HAD family hydrolase [Nanoarchaeota archaeon]
MKLICFDLDNTLVKSDKLHIKAFQKAFEDYKLKKVDDKAIKDLLSITANKIIKNLYPSLSDKKVMEILKVRNKYSVKYSKIKGLIKVFSDSIDVIKKLKKKYKVCLLSNSSHKEIEGILKGANIDTKLFDMIIGADEVKCGKPCPDEIFKAERLMHHKVDYMVGDSPTDILTGKKAGCKTIAVLTGDFSKETLEKEKPDFIIKNLKELPDLID